MYRLEWKPLAEDDLDEIIDFIANDSPNNAEHFAAELRTKVNKLQEHPELYRRGHKPDTREMVVHPNYLVIFRVLKKKRVVEILRVKHASKQWPTQ